MAQTLINGQAYAWAIIKLNILGRDVVGVSSINYDDEQDMEHNYGAGNRPFSEGLGRISCSGSIELFMEELVALQKASPTGRLQDLGNFDIIVSYVPANKSAIVKDVLKGCRFKNNGRGVSEGDMNISKEIQLLVAEIKWGK